MTATAPLPQPQPQPRPADPGGPVPPPPGDGAPGGRGPTGRVLLVAGSVLGALFLVWGALHLVDLALSDTTTRAETYAAAGTVELVADGQVTVRAGDVTTVEVDGVAKGGLGDPTYRAESSGDRLEVTHECTGIASWLSWRCVGELEVTLPADTQVVVRTSNGDVVASGVAGDVRLDTSNGSVEAAQLGGGLTASSSNGDLTVSDVTGDADVRSSNGDIEVTGVGGRAVTDTSNGSIELSDVDGPGSATSSNGRVEVSGVAGDVRAESSNGDVTVHGDGEPVALTITTSHGEQTVEGPTDPAADRTVEVVSSNGDVAYLVP